MTVGELKSYLSNREDTELVKVRDIDDYNDPVLIEVEASYIYDVVDGILIST